MISGESLSPAEGRCTHTHTHEVLTLPRWIVCVCRRYVTTHTRSCGIQRRDTWTAVTGRTKAEKSRDGGRRAGEFRRLSHVRDVFRGVRERESVGKSPPYTGRASRLRRKICENHFFFLASGLRPDGVRYKSLISPPPPTPRRLGTLRRDGRIHTEQTI